MLSDVSCPFLAISGTKDLHVDSGKSLPSIKTALRRGGNQEIEFHELSGLNHLLQPCKTGESTEWIEIEQTIDEKVLSLIVDWMKVRAFQSGN